MRTIIKAVYKFDELSKSAKQAAISNLSEINVMDDFWCSRYEMATLDGIEITYANLQKRVIKGQLTKNVASDEVAYNIINNWTDRPKLTNIAKTFLRIYSGKTNEGLEVQFLEDVLNEYLDLLLAEYDLQKSEALIIETIQANDYEFYENGQLIEAAQFLAN